LISSIVWYALHRFIISRFLIHSGRVKRGASARHPSKQPLNDADIERIKEIADIQLEDARTELERANAVAHAMSQRVEESDVDDMKAEDEDEDSAWVECVSRNVLRMSD
jgi:hypothetical protein